MSSGLASVEDGCWSVVLGGLLLPDPLSLHGGGGGVGGLKAKREVRGSAKQEVGSWALLKGRFALSVIGRGCWLGLPIGLAPCVPKEESELFAIADSSSAAQRREVQKGVWWASEEIQYWLPV